MRYNGTDTILSVPNPTDGRYNGAFEREYFREFGFTMPGVIPSSTLLNTQNPIVVESLKMVGLGKSTHISPQTIEKRDKEGPIPEEFSRCYFNVPGSEAGWLTVPVYVLSKLAGGDKVQGPALIIDPMYFMTVVLEPETLAQLVSSLFDIS